MSAYTDQVLVDKLSKLNNTQQTLSHWIMYHKKRYAQSVKIWEREVFKAPSPEKKLTYIYLANDIMQNSRKKGGEFIKEFCKVLKPCMLHVFREGDGSIQKSIWRVLDVWDERKVVSGNFIDEIRKALKGESGINNNAIPQQPLVISNTEPQNTTTSTQSSQQNVTVIQTPNDLLVQNPSLGVHPFLDEQQKITEGEVTVVLEAERVNAVPGFLQSLDSLGGVKDESTIAAITSELNESLKHLESYKQKINELIERRENFISRLTDMLESQEADMNKNKSSLQDCNKYITQCEERLQEIQSGEYFNSTKRSLSDTSSPNKKQKTGGDWTNEYSNNNASDASDPFFKSISPPQQRTEQSAWNPLPHYKKT